MKKLFIISRYSPLDQGGIEKAIKIYIDDNEINKYYKIKSIFFNKKLLPKIKYKFTEFIEINKFFTIFNNPFSVKYIYLFFKNLKSCDIIHFHFPNILAIFVLIFLKKKNHKIIIHWHSDILTYRIFYFFIIPFEKIIINKSDSIIVTSYDYYKSSLPLKNIPESKITIIPTGSPNRLLSKYVRPYKKNYILSIGRLVKYKGFDKLIKAYAISKKKNDLIIVGDGPEFKKLNYLIKKYDIRNNVKILSNIDDSNLLNYIEFCDFFALTSQNRQEALGLVFIESMKFKKAILTTFINGSGVNSIVINNFNGLVTQNNIKKISKSMDVLSQNNELKLNLGTNGYHFYIKNLTSNIYIDRINNLYHELLR